MINGAHTIVYSTRPDATGPHWSGAGDPVCGCRGRLRSSRFPGPRSRPSGRGGRRAEHYLLCDDVAATGTALQAEGIEVAQPISHQSWGLLTAIPLPGGFQLGLYEPRHRTAAQPSRAHRLSHTISACK
jgi:hypothetical protein